MSIRVCSRSREGAWIEISMDLVNELYGDVAPVRERGLKFLCHNKLLLGYTVAPVRERGLKYYKAKEDKKLLKSLP